jgi:hypothetical protein
MHDQRTTTSATSHVPFKQEGWGIAFFVVLLAAASAAGAYYVHTKTYRPPTDVRYQAIGASATHH